MMKSKLFKHLTLPEMYNLDVGDGNKIYVEVSGKKDGIPIILHTGGQVGIVEVNTILFLIQKYSGQ